MSEERRAQIIALAECIFAGAAQKPFEWFKTHASENLKDYTDWLIRSMTAAINQTGWKELETQLLFTRVRRLAGLDYFNDFFTQEKPR